MSAIGRESRTVNFGAVPAATCDIPAYGFADGAGSLRRIRTGTDFAAGVFDRAS